MTIVGGQGIRRNERRAVPQRSQTMKSLHDGFEREDEVRSVVRDLECLDACAGVAADVLQECLLGGEVDIEPEALKESCELRGGIIDWTCPMLFQACIGLICFDSRSRIGRFDYRD